VIIEPPRILSEKLPHNDIIETQLSSNQSGGGRVAAASAFNFSDTLRNTIRFIQPRTISVGYQAQCVGSFQVEDVFLIEIYLLTPI
jgi:hypothetical protein